MRLCRPAPSGYHQSMHASDDSGWYLYMLQCGDQSLYTGIALDVDARLAAHRSGKGARYTRGRGELTLVYIEAVGNRSDALKRERAVKKLSRQAKLALIGRIS